MQFCCILGWEGGGCVCVELSTHIPSPMLGSSESAEYTSSSDVCVCVCVCLVCVVFVFVCVESGVQSRFGVIQSSAVWVFSRRASGKHCAVSSGGGGCTVCGIQRHDRKESNVPHRPRRLAKVVCNCHTAFMLGVMRWTKTKSFNIPSYWSRNSKIASSFSTIFRNFRNNNKFDLCCETSFGSVFDCIHICRLRQGNTCCTFFNKFDHNPLLCETLCVFRICQTHSFFLLQGNIHFYHGPWRGIYLVGTVSSSEFNSGRKNIFLKVSQKRFPETFIFQKWQISTVICWMNVDFLITIPDKSNSTP